MVDEPADLAVLKSGPATAAPGDTISYILTVTNAGPGEAADVVVRDPTLEAFGATHKIDVETGEAYYHQQRLPGPYNFKSSLVAADGKLYMASENEDVLVARLGEQFEVIATNKLTDAIRTEPTVVPIPKEAAPAPRPG